MRFFIIPPFTLSISLFFCALFIEKGRAEQGDGSVVSSVVQPVVSSVVPSLVGEGIPINSQEEREGGGGGPPSWFLLRDNNPQKWAVLPVYAHNSTYGHIMGARFFVYPVDNTGYYTSLESVISTDLFFSTSFTYQYWRENGDQLSATLLYDGFSEPYYGLGPNTQPEDRKDIAINKGHIQLEYVSRWQSHLYGGAFIGFDYRQDTSKKPVYEPETTLWPGFLIRYDSRNNYFNTTRGEYYELKSWLLFPIPSPVFVTAEARLFFALSPSWTLALQGSAGVTLLNPSPYTANFSLGGPKKLRGYRYNRFQGERYYLSQWEIRYTPVGFLTVAGFFDVGSAGDRFPLPPRSAFGTGIRVGLPPDYNKKIRLEAGFSQDQYNIIVAFGHPF